MKKGRVVLLPASGKLAEQSFIMFNNALGKIIKYNNNSSIIILQGLEEEMEVPSRALHLMKYYIIDKNSRVVGELSYDDYNKVRDGDYIHYTYTPIIRKAEVGNLVKVTKLGGDIATTAKLLEYVGENKLHELEGVIVGARGNLYTIKILQGDLPIVTAKRGFFELIPSNIKKICFYNEPIKPSYKPLNKKKL